MKIHKDEKIITRIRGCKDPGALEEAVQLLKSGQVVAFPTETVYGLGALCETVPAVRKIFEVKGRPADNPLIVHVDGVDRARELVREWTPLAEALVRAFWPGPLTLVLERAPGLPSIISAGLPTVAMRMPAHPCALRLIALAGPIAAPSANASGRPSPTQAEHVYKDMKGRIPLILDGGPCEKGLESTVLDITGDVPVILRPGHVTPEDIAAIAGGVRLSPGVLSPLPEGVQAASPGLMHRHYAPQSRVCVYCGEEGAVRAHMAQEYAALQEAGFRPLLIGTAPWTACESRVVEDAQDFAKKFYAILLESEMDYTHLLVQGVDKHGVGLALMNRALRAAGFSVKYVDDTETFGGGGRT
ncbi:MAG: L-threonylcarbamoyladenylate synthase [Bacillota bacterium]